MSEFRLLTAIEAAEAIGAANARGFLGVDPVTQNDDLMARELARSGAKVFRTAETIVGCVVNQDNPRQANVACTGDAPAPLADFLTFLHRHLRCTSFLAVGDESLLTACGFTRIGTLADNVYRGGRHHDEHLFHRAHRAHRAEEEPCAD